MKNIVAFIIIVVVKINVFAQCPAYKLAEDIFKNQTISERITDNSYSCQLPDMSDKKFSTLCDLFEYNFNFKEAKRKNPNMLNYIMYAKNLNGELNIFCIDVRNREELLKKIDLNLLIEIGKVKIKNFRLNATVGISPEGIKEIRNLIANISDESLRAVLYEDLQADVEYKNQLANEKDPRKSCNVSALSEVFAFFGVDKNPDELTQEAVLRKLDKEGLSTRKILAEENGLKQKVFYPMQEQKEKISVKVEDEFVSAKKIDAELKKGNAVMMSVGGHLVRVVGVKKDEKGNFSEFIVNDPYGKDMDYDVRKSYLKEGSKKIFAEVAKKDSDIKTLEEKNNRSGEEQKRLDKLKVERDKLADNGYGCLVNEICERKNNAGDNKSQKGRNNIRSIQELKDSGIGISYYEIYSPKN